MMPSMNRWALPESVAQYARIMKLPGPHQILHRTNLEDRRQLCPLIPFNEISYLGSIIRL